MIDIYNVNNGSVFLRMLFALRRTEDISLNGAAAHMADLGDIVIIAFAKWMSKKPIRINHV